MTNNVAVHGEYGILGRDRGVGQESIKAYLPGATITRNVLAGGNASAYPSGNFFPSVDELRKQFVNADRRDYRLIPGSPWLKAATDGRALGANVDATR
jgi:hypothetical protein